MKPFTSKSSITVLGSGGFAPSAPGTTIRNPSGYALSTPEELVLVDVGFGNIRQLALAGFRYEDVSHILLSHYHPDHWGGLPELLFLFRYGPKPPEKRLTICGPEGLAELVENIHKTFRGNTVPDGYAIDIKELRPGETVAGRTFSARCSKVEHTPEAIAYRITVRGSDICYTGDAKYSSDLASFCNGADIVIADAGFPSGVTGKPHMTVSEAVNLGKNSSAKLTVLTHLSAESEQEAVNTAAGGDGILAAKDLLNIQFETKR